MEKKIRFWFWFGLAAMTVAFAAGSTVADAANHDDKLIAVAITAVTMVCVFVFMWPIVTGDHKEKACGYTGMLTTGIAFMAGGQVYPDVSLANSWAALYGLTISVIVWGLIYTNRNK